MHETRSNAIVVAITIIIIIVVAIVKDNVIFIQFSSVYRNDTLTDTQQRCSITMFDEVVRWPEYIEKIVASKQKIPPLKREEKNTKIEKRSTDSSAAVSEENFATLGFIHQIDFRAKIGA